MRPDQIVSLRTSLAYLIEGDDLGRRIRLGLILAAMAVPWIIGVAAIIVIILRVA